ncbi:spondin-2-like [Rhodnius prolixus]|uniref:spondin-2-like n=1 Tax=Rhodnius prolixus TaxID=13249 RepID=UPI003D18B3AD
MAGDNIFSGKSFYPPILLILAFGMNIVCSCQSDKLASYTVVMHTFWTRDRFPKHYPDWRPTAQFSKLIGMSHDKKWSLFRVGSPVNNQVKTFAETGRWEVTEGQGSPGLLDQFTGPPVPSGQGRTEAQFFLDGNHSMVSLMSRIIPSPDWFVGLDSFQLCVDGNWLDTITIEVDPLDAGTDNGFTFTAANWATEPQGVVYRITSRFPAHPAGSFYYPYIKRLPPIATFQFIKLKEYEVSEVFHHGEDDKNYEVIKSDQQNVINVMHGNEEIQEEIEQETKEQEVLMQHQSTIKDNHIHSVATKTPAGGGRTSTGHNLIRKGDTEALMNSIVETYHNLEPHKYKFKKSRTNRDCRVSDWGAWGACSSSCGVGEMSRHRTIVKPARGNGHQCPPLKQTRWCGGGGATSPSGNCTANTW